MKRILKKVLGRGKLTVLAVVAAFTLATTAPALAANGSNFILGVATNTATAITQLTTNIANPALKLVNTSTAAGATALNLQTAATTPPMTVNSATKVTNLNADTVDGKDSSTIGRELWVVVNWDATIERSSGAIRAKKATYNHGHFWVTFNRDVSKCAYVATTDNGYAGNTGVNGGVYPNEVEVFTASTHGSAEDLPFHLVVTC